MENFERISGKELAGNPYEAIKTIVEMFDNVNISLNTLRDLETFEEVAVGLAILKYKILLKKNQDYGRDSIKNGDVVKVLERLGEKIARAKNLIGDPSQQVEKAKIILNTTPDDASMTELLDAIKALDRVFFPAVNIGEEGVEDTMLDASNYSDIVLQLLLGVWNKPYRSEV